MSSDFKQNLSSMVKAIIEEANPEQIILFGSRATEQHRPDSDFDFLVIQREPFGAKRDRWREMTKIRRALAGFRMPVDVLLYSSEEVAKWRHSINHIIAQCLKEGRVLYERS